VAKLFDTLKDAPLFQMRLPYYFGKLEEIEGILKVTLEKYGPGIILLVNNAFLAHKELK